MTKKMLVLILIISSCSVKKEVLGIYKTDKNNVIDITLILQPKNKFVMTYYGSMVSDSIFGDYKIDKRQVKLISKTKAINFSKNKKTREKKTLKSSLFFKNSKMSFSSFIDEPKLILNDTLEKKIIVDYDSKPIKINCNDKVVYSSNNLLKQLKSLDCKYDYDILVYSRIERKIIPDTLNIDFTNVGKIGVLNNTLKKKRKHNTIYSK